MRIINTDSERARKITFWEYYEYLKSDKGMSHYHAFNDAKLKFKKLKM